jgi:hypothetical protein
MLLLTLLKRTCWQSGTSPLRVHCSLHYSPACGCCNRRRTCLPHARVLLHCCCYCCPRESGDAHVLLQVLEPAGLQQRLQAAGSIYCAAAACSCCSRASSFAMISSRRSTT